MKDPNESINIRINYGSWKRLRKIGLELELPIIVLVEALSHLPKKKVIEALDTYYFKG